jgi:protein-disulfide isomerase
LGVRTPAVLILPLGLALAGALSGCTNDGLPGQLLTGAAAPDGITGEAQSTVDNRRADPFGDSGVQPLGGREVIANPSIAEVMKAGPLAEMALGRENAPVTIVQYASMTCPYCRKFQAEVFPVLKREYIDTGKVRYILREFPIGFQSGAATLALRCAPPEKYFALYDKLMAQQGSWVSQEVRTEPIFKVAAQVGMTRAQFDACRQNQGMIAALNSIKERGRTLGVIGTPNFFINGKLIKTTLDIAQLRAIIDPLIAGQATTAKRT